MDASNWKHIIEEMLSGVTITISIQRHKEPSVKTSEKPEHYVKCEYCEWSGIYHNPDSAARALRAHQQHCSTYAKEMEWIIEMNRNRDTD